MATWCHPERSEGSAEGGFRFAEHYSDSTARCARRFLRHEDSQDKLFTPQTSFRMTKTTCSISTLTLLLKEEGTEQKQGLAMLYGIVQRQAMMLSFNDIYRMLCLLMILMIPSFVLLRRDSRNVSASAH